MMKADPVARWKRNGGVVKVKHCCGCSIAVVSWKFSSGKLETLYCGTLSIAVEYFILSIAILAVEMLFTFQFLCETIFSADVG